MYTLVINWCWLETKKVAMKLIRNLIWSWFYWLKLDLQLIGDNLISRYWSNSEHYFCDQVGFFVFKHGFNRNQFQSIVWRKLFFQSTWRFFCLQSTAFDDQCMHRILDTITLILSVYIIFFSVFYCFLAYMLSNNDNFLHLRQTFASL